MTLPIQREETKNFCILTTQRSGSTWMVELLNNDPRIKMFSEVFLWNSKNKISNLTTSTHINQHSIVSNDEKSIASFRNYSKVNSGFRPWLTFKYLDQLNFIDGEYSAVGFKIMYDQLAVRPEVLLKIIYSKYRILHLVRENYLDILISKASMKQHGYVHIKSEKDILPVILEKSTLLKQLSSRESISKSFSNLLKFLPNQSLEITYEALCDNKNAVMSSILDFLELPNQNIEYVSQLKKINKGSYRQKIDNYSEIEEVLRDTKFASLLHQG